MHRRHLIALLVGTVTAVAATSAHAQWAVLDGSALAEQVIHVAKTVQLMANTYTQIENQKQQIQNELQTLKSIDPSTFKSLTALLNQSTLTYSMIRSDVDSLGFSVKDITRDFDGLFPKDKNKWKAAEYGDYDSYYTRWNSELTASSKAADRSQANIIIVEQNNKAIADILSQSQGAAGEVRQLQLINQQLALIHQELGTLVQNMAAATRVSADEQRRALAVLPTFLTRTPAEPEAYAGSMGGRINPPVAEGMFSGPAGTKHAGQKRSGMRA